MIRGNENALILCLRRSRIWMTKRHNYLAIKIDWMDIYRFRGFKNGFGHTNLRTEIKFGTLEHIIIINLPVA